MRKTLLTSLFALMLPLCIFADENNVRKVACIGNSITYGLRVDNREVNNYPTRLQGMLGDGYEVRNFGHSGATLLREGHRPYILTEEWKAAKEFAPDIAVIHLGTNDTDPRNWPNYGRKFVGDYKALIDTLKIINPDVRVIVANMAPIGAAHPRYKTGTRAWRDSIRSRIVTVADLTGSELIDFADPLRDFPNLFPDAVHPNVDGARRLAEYTCSAITGNWGGLRLPEVWQSGMVVPWGRAFTIPGHADANADIKVRVGEKEYSAKADNRGRWSVTVGPLPIGDDFSIKVYDGKDILILDNVTAGEVWLASGQSNMAFMIQQAVDSPEDFDSNPMIRFFDMQPIAFTDNKNQWDEETMAKIANLEHYRKGSWGAPRKTSSAVAYNFARNLADSLKKAYGHDVPVGIVANPVGGSGTEAWIDIETLEHVAPDALVDWKHNDWLQPWVQQRAGENSGSDRSDVRHPYEPSYLFASGIRPLEGFPFKGVIWYQGESNAHNVELHELYFKTLIDSWRKKFDNPDLPFVFAQLSGINRPSWPEFRDSQRKLAEELENVSMAVTSDLGDPYDVHPKRKAPVGRRMALQALANVYGLTGFTHEGPMPIRTSVTADSRLYVKMRNADGLTVRDSLPVRWFEIAEIEDQYLPAEVEIVSDGVILSNSEIKNPRYARYAWQPYTDANMINKDSIPASTFKVVADAFDKGYEHGVSGSFGGILPDGRVITAGGCNFPFEDPIAVPASAKTFYAGIYDAFTGERIGQLPKTVAYGASATTRHGVAMIGGQDNTECWMFDGVTLKPLPSLPQPVDNGYAAAIDDTIYLLGGYYLYQLLPGASEWKPIERVPGDPRVQPVMAASGDRLYIWGGFTPSLKGSKPKVHDNGFMYEPTTKKWTKLPDVTVNGTPVTLSGGVAATAPDGSIIAAGGVNHQVFLDAITAQAPDYLHHPAEWYRFNPYVLRFDPKNRKWTLVAEGAATARAGSAAVVSDGNLIMMGGELKPRIRATDTVSIPLK